MENYYNEKVTLLVDYQWYTEGFKDCGDNILIDKVFNSVDEAYNAMEHVMPDDYDFDDGYDFTKWYDMMAEGEDDIFTQYASNIDDHHCFLAVFRPVRKEFSK